MRIKNGSTRLTASDQLKLNQAQAPLAVFVGLYNKSIPAGFPQASVKTLQQFQALHPMLFKSGGEWSVDRHRKRLMDWLSSHRDIPS